MIGLMIITHETLGESYTKLARHFFGFGEYGVEPAGSPAACIASAQQMILEALGGDNACLVAHYGLLTVGPNPRAAVSLARQLEALCRIYWQALQVGGVRVMPIRTR